MRRPVNPLNLPEFEVIGRPLENEYDLAGRISLKTSGQRFYTAQQQQPLRGSVKKK